MKNVMQAWLKEATVAERSTLIKLAKTTLGSLRQLIGAYRTKGKLRASPEMAIALEKAASKVHREGLPPIRREDLCPACGKCELAKIARAHQADVAAMVPRHGAR